MSSRETVPILVRYNLLYSNYSALGSYKLLSLLGCEKER
jgi:hypothetical protein